MRASDGHELYTEVHGERGIPLLLSCGLCTTHVNWRPQVEPLVAAGARVILWDFRGHGRSEAPEDPAAYSLGRVRDDLLELMDTVAPDEPVVLGGLSFGGSLSLHATLARPERVRALLLIDTGPGFKNPEAQARWEAQVERTASFVETRGPAAFVQSRAATTLIGPNPNLPAAAAAAKAIGAQQPHGLANFARRVAGPAPPVIERLGEIACPSLVIVGEHDEAYLRAAEVLGARIPGAKSVTLPGAGHITNIEAEGAFNEAVIAFLASLRS